MAFDVNKLSALNNVEKEEVRYWVYDNKAGDTVTASGFFAHAALKVRDQIDVVNASGAGRTGYYVSAVSNGKATVTANTSA